MNARTHRTLLAAAAAALLAGCVHVPRATPELDAQAKKFAAPSSPSHAAVYVYRNETYGTAAKLSILLDDRFVADTTGHTFVWFNVGAGKYKLVSKGENDAVVDLDAKPGRSYFFWQEVKMGFMSPRTELHAVDEAVGKSGVAECELVVTGAPAQ